MTDGLLSSDIVRVLRGAARVSDGEQLAARGLAFASHHGYNRTYNVASFSVFLCHRPSTSCAPDVKSLATEQKGMITETSMPHHDNAR
jgi:hypothetical protein